MNENELLELNADLMILIKEKQERGALHDATWWVFSTRIVIVPEIKTVCHLGPLASLL